MLMRCLCHPSHESDLFSSDIHTQVTVFKETSDEILGEGAHSLDNVTKAEAAVQSAYAEYAKAVGKITCPKR